MSNYIITKAYMLVQILASKCVHMGVDIICVNIYVGAEAAIKAFEWRSL